MLITISRPGRLPHQSIRAKLRYRDGQPAPIADGSSFELLRGRLCGAATLRFSAPPDFRPLDWVRVYLPGDPCLPGQSGDRPRYLGEVVSEPWEAGEGEIVLQGLTERVRKAAWRGPVVNGEVQKIEDFLKPYLLNVLGRCGLGAVTVDEIPDYRAKFRSVNPFERLGDTLDAMLPALPGGVAGVDAQARFHVQPELDAVTLRFSRSRSERPPGRTDNYANAVRFRYTKPSGEEAWFELVLTLEVAAYGQEAWTEESLPASVTTTLTNPYAGQKLRVFSSLRYPGENAVYVSRNATLDSMNPAWTGHQGDGVAWDTRVLAGAARRITAPSVQGVAFQSTSSATYTLPNLPSDLRIKHTNADGKTRLIAPTYNTLSTGETIWTGRKDGGPRQPAGLPDWSLEINYVEAGNQYEFYIPDLEARRQEQGQYPLDFDVTYRLGSDQNNTPLPEHKVTLARWVVSVMEPDTPQLVSNEYQITGGHGDALLVAPEFLLPNRVDLHLPFFSQWRAGDQVTTDAAVTAVSITDTVTTKTYPLTRAEDDPETGRRRWTLPQDARADGVTLAGDPAKIGWVGLELTDEAGLTTYAFGLLRNRVQPARTWKGLIRRFDDVRVEGRARFDTPGGDVELDIQKATYDLGSQTITMECGTPWPRDDAEALAGAIDRVERAALKAGG